MTPRLWGKMIQSSADAWMTEDVAVMVIMRSDDEWGEDDDEDEDGVVMIYDTEC
jgi:hypothetical protein